jgi:hypothetical protein
LCPRDEAGLKPKDLSLTRSSRKSRVRCSFSASSAMRASKCSGGILLGVLSSSRFIHKSACDLPCFSANSGDARYRRIWSMRSSSHVQWLKLINARWPKTTTMFFRSYKVLRSCRWTARVVRRQTRESERRLSLDFDIPRKKGEKRGYYYWTTIWGEGVKVRKECART